MKILYINGCVDIEHSRTNQLARVLLENIRKQCGQQEAYVEELILEQNLILPLTAKQVNKRKELCAKHDYADPMFDAAKQFAEADTIVLAAPYWDMSFPAIVKDYIENICVLDLTFGYDEQGIPKGLCKAKELIYVTTSGGPIGKYNLGYEYVKSLCEVYWGINHTEFIAAENLDLYGNDAQKILQGLWIK